MPPRPVRFLVYLLAALSPGLGSLTASPVISEFASAGQGVWMDDDEDYPDWLELHNPGDTPYALTDHYLTDDPQALTKWTFPRGQALNPDQRLVIFASRKNRQNIFQAAIHTNFDLPADSLYLALVAPDGETVLHAWEDPPRQRVGVTYGIGAEGQAGYFEGGTPGASNPVALPSVVKDTKFSVNRGFHDAAFDLEITSATEDATIYYTLNGDVPGPETGARYEAPVRIEATTVVRAVAMKAGMISTDVDTHSYLFLTSVLEQPEAPAGFPQRWGPVPADYAFDTSVGSTEEFETALLSYPSISLVMPNDSWFDPRRVGGEGGIYANSLERGLDWEKAVSAEFIGFEGTEDAQVDCGIRIYGNASRQTSRPKHNMRLAFRARYGAAKLDFPVFGKGKATGINGLLFNGQNGDSWFHPAIGQRQAASYIRDHFAHELLADMGHPSPPHSRAHLYINGLYWGFYQTVERVDQHFMARLFGGEPEEYDSMKASTQTGPTLVGGSTKAYHAMFDVANAGVDDDAGYLAIQQYLDLDSFIDYMMINFWTGNRDWDHNNWRNGRHRSEGSPWYYVMWDSENIFKEAGIDRTGNNTADNPTRLHSQLSKHPAYRLKFADHVQRHLFNDGLLTEASVKARWKRWADYIRPGLKAESARWGDHHRPGNPHTVEDDFEAAYDNLMENLFPARARNVIRQFENRGLYPEDLQPITFNQHGGAIEAGFRLALSAGSIFQPQEGDLVFTLDGRDPMETEQAERYQGPITLETSVTVNARVQDPSGRWGPLTSARFTVGQPPQPGELFVSEIHYHPASPNDAENPDDLWSRTDFEFLEIWNASDRTLQLKDVRLTEGVRFVFPEAELAPGERRVVAEQIEAFVSRYGTTPEPIGRYQGQLSNGGEQLTLLNAAGNTLHTVFYDDEAPWPLEADGDGPSLVLADQTQAETAAGWSVSEGLGGSPGQPDEGDGPSTTLPADFASWMARQGTEDILSHYQNTNTSLLVAYALGLDLPPSAGWIQGGQFDGEELSLQLRLEAASWEVEVEGSSDLQSWNAGEIGIEIEQASGATRRWRLTEGRLPYYRFRLSLP